MSAKARSFKVRIEDFDAPDVRAFYDSSMLRVWHLQGQERTYRIERVQRITKQEGDEVEKRAALRLSNKSGELPLPLELNPTNRDTIRKIYGDKPREWIGKLITLYPTTCEAFGETKACIRIRNYDPSKRGPRAKTNAQGVHVLPTKEELAAAAPPEEADAGLELHDDALDVKDSTDDDEEPPFGSLLTDNSAQ